jgi:hypothetical protein
MNTKADEASRIAAMNDMLQNSKSVEDLTMLTANSYITVACEKVPELLDQRTTAVLTLYDLLTLYKDCLSIIWKVEEQR